MRQVAGFFRGEKVALEYSADSGASWQAIPGADTLAAEGACLAYGHGGLRA